MVGVKIKKKVIFFVNETMFMTPEFEGDLFVNEVTWFELACQYLVILLEVKKLVILLD